MMHIWIQDEAGVMTELLKIVQENYRGRGASSCGSVRRIGKKKEEVVGDAPQVPQRAPLAPIWPLGAPT